MTELSEFAIYQLLNLRYTLYRNCELYFFDKGDRRNVFGTLRDYFCTLYTYCDARSQCELIGNYKSMGFIEVGLIVMFLQQHESIV